MKKDFYDKPLYSILNYLFGFLQVSFNFVISNILLILFIVYTSLSQSEINLLLAFICLIPLGPSIGALYSTVSKIIREKDFYFSYYFWSSYKENFLSFLKLWLIHLIVITICFIDFKYFYSTMPSKGIHTIFIAFIIISLVISLYSFPLNSRFQLKLKDLFALSIYYTIRKFPLTILKVVVMCLTYFLANHISLLFLFFMPSIICVIFYFYDKRIFLEIEDKFAKNKDTTLNSNPN